MTFNLFRGDEVRELKPLRGRQIGVIDAIAQAVKEGHKRIVVQAPTGMGKTVLAAHLMDRSAKKHLRPMFICPAIALVEQTLESFEAQGISDIGVIQAQHHRTDWKAQVQIASRDTLVRRLLPQVDFAIVDEVHDMRESLQLILNSEAWKDKIVIGLSATPWTRGLGLHYTKLIVAATMRQMIEDGAPTGLSPFKVFGAQYDPDMSKVKVVAGEFQESGAATVMSTSQIIGDVVETWLKHRQLGNHPGDRTFLYGVHRAHAKSLMEAFKAEGISFGYVDGETGAEERRRVFERYDNREDKGICNVGVLVTGVDKDVRCLVDVAPNNSEMAFVQKWGRAARLADGKLYALGLDHAGNCARLGYPWDIHHDTLDTRGPNDKKDAYEDERPTPKPRKCKQCFAMIPASVQICPTCGYVPVRENNVVHEKGELQLLGDNLFAMGKPKKPKKQEATMEQKQAFYSGALTLAHERGKSEGFAAHMYRERYSVWPNQLQKVRGPVFKEVQAFDRHRRIRWAKSQEKASVAK